MKITDVIVHPLQADHGHLTWTAHEGFGRAILTLVEVRTDEGVTGIGEVASGPQAVVCDMLEMIKPVIVGKDPLGHVDLWDLMFSLTTPRRNAIFDGDGLPPPLARHLRWPYMAAMAGIDIALWDIKGKAANLPVFRVMGGTRTDVFTYAVGGMYRRNGTPADYARELADFVDAGFEAVKLKSGALPLEKEVERIRAVRDAIGPDVQLALDVNAAYDLEECIEYANRVAEFDIAWLEEPLHWYLPPSAYARLARDAPLPLAHGEREWHRFALRDYIDSGALRYVQFDSARFGGITEGLRVGIYAEQRNVMVQPHSWPHLHAHVASALGKGAYGAECVPNPAIHHPIHHRIYQGGAYYRDGRLRLTEAPGFGVEVDWAQVKKLEEGNA
ncbi:MAG: mandelate racemase/muconate lactonizing enzyme family protein [Burkholderiales bacterium]